MDRFGTRRYEYTEWTVIRATHMPDGEYTVTTEDGFRFLVTRMRGLWLRGNAGAAA